MAWFLLLLLIVCSTGGSTDVDLEDSDWGSGLPELLHSFPAHSPFFIDTSEHVANCTHRFLLPLSSPMCWEDIAGPDEFKETRLLVLQNRAALHAVTEASGLEEGGVSYEQQAMTDVQGVQEDHLRISQTVESMQKVFFDLGEKRKMEGEYDTFASLKEQITNTMSSINGGEEMAALLEQRLSQLERTLNTLQNRLTQLLHL